MAQKAGYLVDLRTVQLNDLDSGNASSWIQAMPIGKYKHPVYGDIDITPERVMRFAANVNSGVRGQELDIDYDHKDKTNEAAGWVQQAEARLNDPDPKNNGLWVLVEWVKDAKEKILSKAYRYFSPEFDDEWTHPVSGETFKDVLFGGGITNRPFLKGILPLNLSEKFAEVETEEHNMFTDEQRVALRKRFGLADDADDAAIVAAIVSIEDAVVEPPAEVADETETETDADDAEVESAEVIELSEAEHKVLSENPATARLLSLLETNNKRLRELEIKETVTLLSDRFATKKLAIPPTVKEALTSVIRLSETTKLNDAVVQLMSKIAEVGFVQLGETEIPEHTHEDLDATDALNARIKELQETKKVSYADAASMAASELGEAYAVHRENSYL